MEGESMNKIEAPWGSIPDNWIISSVATEAKRVTDYVANGSFASLAENVEYKTEEDYAVLIRLVDYNNSFKGPFVFIDEKAYNFLSKSKLFGGEIIISNVGANVGTVFLCPYLKYNMSLAPNSITVHFKGNDIFYYYWLRSKYGQHGIKSLITGSAQPKFNKTAFRQMLIPVPPLDVQNQIAGILSSLDAKIETNNKLNDKLEEMAQAIFKSWFVDFEPFKDKPFHETELGMIPEGWEVSTFSSIIEKLISGDWGKETPTGNYVHKVACIRGCDFENIKNGLRGKTPERFILERNFASKQPKPNDIVVEMSGGTATVSTGRICYITKELLDQYEGDIVCTNFCKIVRPLKGWSQYLYYYWQYKYDKKVMFCYENGTSGIKNFAINDFIDFESILIPPKDELIKFNSIIDNIRVKIQMNGVENTRLASLRDTLLPRLMSGELIV